MAEDSAAAGAGRPGLASRLGARLGEFAHRYGPPLLVLALALGLRVSGLDWIEDFRSDVFDYCQRLKPRPYKDVPVRVIDLDDDSLEKLGQWPWPRTQVAKLVGRLRDLGVSTIVFDMVFAEPDRTSPSRAIKQWPRSPEIDSLRARASSLPDNDSILARAFSSANVVAGCTLVPDANDKVPVVKSGFASSGDSPLSYVPDFAGAVTNLPVLERAAAGVGSFGFLPERDGVVRRVPLLFRKGTVLIPSLALEALRVAQGAANVTVKASGGHGETSYGAHTGIVAIKVGNIIIPTDANGRIWVHYSPRVSDRTLPAWRIFEKDFPKDALADSIVFFGTSAMGLMDIRVTATDPAAPGVEVHANVVEQALLGDYLRRPDWASGAEVLYLLVLGLAMVFLLPLLGAAWCALIAFGSVGASVYASWHAYLGWHYLLDPIFPSIVILSIYLVASLAGYLRTESEKKHIRGAFGQYLPPVLVEQLANHPERLKLGGELRTITIHFCDIRGFTTISEQYDPIGLTRQINKFLTPMTEIIMEHKGCIDKYIGDCIMAFWNAPLDDPEHAANACRAALAMHARLLELNRAWEAEAVAKGGKHLPIKIGTGLNTGDAVVGNLGSEQRFGYSVLGDDVNLASRLEGQSKYYGVKIVIGQGTRDRARDFAFLELDLIRVKGKLQPVRIFTLLGDKAVLESAAFQALAADHEAMLAAYRRQDWDAAQGLIDRCREREPSLKVLYELYEDRIKAFRAEPPGKDWDGVYVATSK